MDCPTAVLRQGRFIGTTLMGDYPQILDAFYGIPFAQSTSGRNRFRPPVPVSASTKTFDASKWGQRPPSMPMMVELEPAGEDCLNLNIFKPRSKDESKQLPVVVIFNGGAFNMGCASMRDVGNVVGWSKEPFIGVSFNYRVGALGFLPCKFMAKEGALNLGLRDQDMLLRWIQENIAALGGDPGAVTALGYSAGAHSVGHHMMNPYDQLPLFQRAIMESGSPTARSVFPYDHPIHEIQFQEFLTELGAEGLPEAQIIPYLQSLPWEKIRDASVDVFLHYAPSLRWPFQPVIDGVGGIIPTAPIVAWESGKWHKIPVLTGFCTNEGSVFVPQKANSETEFRDWFRTLLPAFSANDIAEIEHMYPDPVSDPTSNYLETRPYFGKQYRRFDAACGQFAYIAPIRQTCHMMSTSSDSDKCPAYLYEFGVVKSTAVGARHADSLQHSDYMSTVTEASSTNKEIAASMHSYWTSFITTGNPNKIPGLAPNRPRWEAYRADETGTGIKMALGVGNEEIAGVRKSGVVAERKDDSWARKEAGFWWSKVPLSQQNPPVAIS